METNYEELFHNERAERIAHQTNANRIIKFNEMLLRANHNLSDATGMQFTTIVYLRQELDAKQATIEQQAGQIEAAQQVIEYIIFGFDHEMIGKGREELQNAIADAREFLKASQS